MFKLFKIIMFTLVLTTASTAYSQLIPPQVISKIQSQFGGRVVGVHNDGATSSVQVLLKNGQMVIVTVDNGSGRIVDVQK